MAKEQKIKLSGRPQPSAPRAGQRPKSKSKYEKGGRVSKKKNV